MKLIYCILVLFLSGIIMASAQVPAITGSGKSQISPIRKPQYHLHPITPLLYEDFERTTGYDLFGWGEDIFAPGVINEDYTTTVLYGAQSLLVDEAHDDPTYTTNSFADSGHVWVAFRFRVTATPSVGAYNTVLRLNDGSDNCQVRMTMNSDMELGIQPDCSSTFIVGFPMSINTTYNVWIEYWKDNGANRYASIAYSESLIRPTDPAGNYFVEGTAASVATDVSRIQIGHNASENGQEVDFILDHLLIDDVQIGNYP